MAARAWNRAATELRGKAAVLNEFDEGGAAAGGLLRVLLRVSLRAVLRVLLSLLRALIRVL